eukprot:331444-Ditylum_brightwellii.AAC.1
MSYIYEFDKTTSEDENGAIYEAYKQLQCEASRNCAHKTYSKNPQAQPVSHVQVTHYSSRHRLTHLQALHTFF